MRDERINYVLVGAFVVAMIVALVISLALLTGRTGPTDDYYTRFDDVTGLKYGSNVLYMGFPVGQVSAIEPVVEDGQVKFDLTLALDREFATWQVPADSVAQVRAEGLLAAIAIDIRAGRSEEALAPGGRIIGRARRDVLAAVSETANTVRDLTVGSVRPLLENLNRYVSSFGDVLETRAGPLIDNLSTLSGELAGRAPEVIDDFLATTRELRAVSGRLERILSEENAGKIDGVVENMLTASQSLAGLTGHAREQVTRLLDARVVTQVHGLVANAGNAASQLDALGSEARAGVAAVLTEDNVKHLSSTLANVDAASAGAAAMLGPEQQRKVDATLDSVQGASASLESLIDDTRGQVERVLSAETMARFDATLVNIADAAANLARLSAHVDARVDDVLTPETARSLRQALGNFARAAGNVATLTRDLGDSRAELHALLSALRSMAEENRTGVRASVRSLRYNLDVVSQHVDAVSANLEGTSRNLLELSRRLKANPGLLLNSGPPADDRPGGSGG